MPTNDERREVAARLREPFDVLPQGRYYHASHTLFGMGLYTSSEVALRLGVRRLADLIEPEERTCRVVTEVRALSLTQDMHTKSCSACGYVFGSEVHTQLLPGLGERVAVDPVVIPNYCPNCGAKVIQE